MQSIMAAIAFTWRCPLSPLRACEVETGVGLIAGPSSSLTVHDNNGYEDHANKDDDDDRDFEDGENGDDDSEGLIKRNTSLTKTLTMTKK